MALPSQDAEAAPAQQPTPSPDQELKLPDGTPIDWSQNRSGHRHRHSPHHHHYRRRHRHYRRRRRVCRTYRDSFGRPVRRCHTVWV